MALERRKTAGHAWETDDVAASGLVIASASANVASFGGQSPVLVQVGPVGLSDALVLFVARVRNPGTNSLNHDLHISCTPSDGGVLDMTILKGTDESVAWTWTATNLGSPPTFEINGQDDEADTDGDPAFCVVCTVSVLGA